VLGFFFFACVIFSHAIVCEHAQADQQSARAALSDCDGGRETVADGRGEASCTEADAARDTAAIRLVRR
jgi:hypothetical protein